MPAVNAVRRGHALPAEQAALTEPLACILHAHAAVRRDSRDRALSAAGRRRRRPASRPCMIAGAGPAGLLFLQHLRQVVGFEGRILVSEPSATRQALARHYGADAVIDPVADDVVDATLTLTAGRRAEYLIDASGSAEVFRQMPGLIRKQATVLLYAHGQSGVDLGRAQHAHVPRAAARLAGGRLRRVRRGWPSVGVSSVARIAGVGARRREPHRHPSLSRAGGHPARVRQRRSPRGRTTSRPSTRRRCRRRTVSDAQ